MVVQQHGHKGGTLTVAAAVLVVLTTGGCSGSGTAAEDGPGAVVEDARAADQVRRAADTLAGAGSSKARTSMEMATGGTRVTIRGEGLYDYRKRLGRLKVLLPPDPAGDTVRRPITELLAPGALFMKNRGAGVPPDKWVRIEVTALPDGNVVTGGATDPITAAELLRGVSYAADLGFTEVDGQTLRHYRGVTDIAVAAEAASGASGEQLAAAVDGFTHTEVPFDAYLDEGLARHSRAV